MEDKILYEQYDRPWGWVRVLVNTSTFKLQQMLIKPGKSSSYQSHKKRDEHWFIVQGEASVTIDDTEMTLSTNQHVDVPAGVKHRIGNTSSEDLLMIEIHTGEYFGEDDTQRHAYPIEKPDEVG